MRHVAIHKYISIEGHCGVVNTGSTVGSAHVVPRNFCDDVLRLLAAPHPQEGNAWSSAGFGMQLSRGRVCGKGDENDHVES